MSEAESTPAAEVPESTPAAGAPGADTPPTLEQIAAAEALAGLGFTEAERALAQQALGKQRAAFAQIRAVPLPNPLAPAFAFDPRLPGHPRRAAPVPAARADGPTRPLPADAEALAFAPLTDLAAWVRTGQISAVALTELYLERLKRYDPLLHCVVTLTEERGLAQARRADAEIAAGGYRGPLHGIPWGAKDLLAVAGYPTNWGAAPYRDQVIDLDATAVARLDAAGAVLVAKLSVGELAMDDIWFGGQTRNPWNPPEGSSGSSAGSAAAVAAGLVGFALGTETWGSIVSPCTRCRVSGLRPTFGRVSRHGAMALSWTMDKIGPIARSVEDCALVFGALHGPDGRDGTVVEAPFAWPPALSLADLRIGVWPGADDADAGQRALDAATLDVLRDFGATLTPVSLPPYPVEALTLILEAEAAAAFDDLTRSDRDDLLARQEADAWPNTLRAARFIPAVEYIQAQRVRTRLMQALADLFTQVDVCIAPSLAGNQLLITNLTGHPAVVVPNGVTPAGAPGSITFLGDLYDEARVLAVAQAYQAATPFHLSHPELSGGPV